MWSIVMPIGVVAIISANAFMPYPWHASCVINWSIPQTCDTVKSLIVKQLQQWESSECPGVSEDCPSLPCGQLCLYNFTSWDSEDLTISGTHQTPKHRFTDDLTFILTEGTDGSSCSVEATSNSRTWYAVLDFGTNYCNLRNIIDGSSISSMNGFTEETEDSVCTQYSSRDCDRF